MFVILSGARPALVNLNSQVFLDPNPTRPKSHTFFSKEIFGEMFFRSAHAGVRTMLTRTTRTNRELPFISRPANALHNNTCICRGPYPSAEQKNAPQTFNSPQTYQQQIRLAHHSTFFGSEQLGGCHF